MHPLHKLRATLDGLPSGVATLLALLQDGGLTFEQLTNDQFDDIKATNASHQPPSDFPDERYTACSTLIDLFPLLDRGLIAYEAGRFRLTDVGRAVRTVLDEM